MGCWNPQAGASQVKGGYEPVVTQPSGGATNTAAVKPGASMTLPNGYDSITQRLFSPGSQVGAVLDSRIADPAANARLWDSAVNYTPPEVTPTPDPQYVSTTTATPGPAAPQEPSSGTPYVGTTPAPTPAPSAPQLAQTYTSPVALPPDAKVAAPQAFQASALGAPAPSTNAYVPPVISRPIFAPGGAPAQSGNPVVAALMRRRRSPWDSYL